MLFWIVFIIYSCIVAKTSILSSQYGGNWFIYTWLLCAVPMFPILTRISSNLLIDSIMYDFLIFVSYTIVYLWCGLGKHFSLYQYFGLILSVIGLVMMKMKV